MDDFLVKSRAKTNTGEWIRGLCFFANVDNKVKPVITGRDSYGKPRNCCDLSPKTLGRYVNVKDGDEEIYERDIVIIDLKGYGVKQVVVEHAVDKDRFVAREIGVDGVSIRIVYIPDIISIKLWGNVFDNPELLHNDTHWHSEVQC